MPEIIVEEYDEKNYDKVIELFKNGTYEHIFYALQNGFRKPKVQLFLGSFLMVLPFSYWYAVIWFCICLCIHVFFVSVFYYGYVQYHMKTDMSDTKLKFWTTKPNEFFIAKIDGLTVGTIAYQQKDPLTVELNRLSVDRNYRRLGIAKILMKELLSKAKNEEFKKVILTTSKNQIGAHKLYENHGFQFAGDEHLGMISDFVTGVNVVKYILHIES